MAGFSDQLDDSDGELAWGLLDAAPDGVLVVNPAGDIVFVNERAVGMFAADGTEQLIGLTVDELLPEQARGAHRAHRTRYRANPEVRAMGAGRTLLARRLDGTEFYTEISLSPLEHDDELLIVADVRDITARVASEDHLHRVLLTLDASDDGVFMFDAETLAYTYVNEGAVRLVAYGRADLFEMTPLHLNPYATESEYHDIVARLLADPDREIRREARLLRKDGVEVPVEKTYRAAPAGRDGSRWIIATARDISARLAAEDELRLHQEALREAEQVVVLADERDRIARDLHDTVIQRLFGTGLGLQSIIAASDGVVRDRLEKAIDDLDDTIRELRSAIFSLQGSAKAGPGGLRGELLAVVNEATTAAGLESRVQFDGPIESLDPAIAAELAPTLREALTNVAKHAQAHTVRIEVTVRDGFAALHVTDDGRGIRGEVFGGHGLTNLRQRAESLGGSLELSVCPEGGSQFCWTVPAEPSPVN